MAKKITYLRKKEENKLILLLHRWKISAVVITLKTSFEFLLSAPTPGFVYRNCTADGWSEMYPPYEEACAFSDDSEPESEVCRHAVVFMPIS